MSTFRNIIARRRPSRPPEPAVSQTSGSRPETLAEMTDASNVADDPATPQVAEDAPRWKLDPPKPTMRADHSGGEDPADGMSEDASLEAALREARIISTDRSDGDKARISDDQDAGSGAREEAALDRVGNAGPQGETPRPPTRRKIWDLAPPGAAAPADLAPSDRAGAGTWSDLADPEHATLPRAVAPDAPHVERDTLAGRASPGPAVAAPAPRSATPAPSPARSGRVKTRLLGFHSDDLAADAFAVERAPAASESVQCPVGWLVIVDGPGRGASFALAPGLSTLGRDAGQTISLDFGDDSISRDNHASVAYDEEENSVLIGHGGKSNLVRLNGKPLVSSEELRTGDQVRVGKTTLRFVALCGPDFSWDRPDTEAPGHG